MNINIVTDWNVVIKSQREKQYWSNLENIVDQSYRDGIVFPKAENIFRCFNYFNISETKVVLIGQDPYPTPGDACGLSFSVERNNNLPHSLQNIFMELRNDLNVVRINGDLSDWAKQGVLLLNSALTFSKDQPNFLKLWEPFTKEIIQYIDTNVNGIVFILWGNFAKSFIPLIKNNQSYIISSGHPSFAASHKQFFNTKPFSKTNNILEKLHKSIIKW
ncbi:MAG: uracil-DNA glycosylase [Mycoplasmataceae bacterium]|jgi:uracil-DNA glycosylase|nr:uracil-DNA glycosylase [Mycoplasmataceae bacterium]